MHLCDYQMVAVMRLKLAMRELAMPPPEQRCNDYRAYAMPSPAQAINSAASHGGSSQDALMTFLAFSCRSQQRPGSSRC